MRFDVITVVKIHILVWDVTLCSMVGGYSWTSEPRRLHHTLCRQPCE
jgi:hypothetical protein